MVAVQQRQHATKSNSVKLHFFEPSGRQIWTVVGKHDEHWIDPELNFCSCKNYYYKTLSELKECYHLTNLKQATENKSFSLIKFHDSEYSIFMTALISDIANKVLCG
jgi:predicted nucleic acid-binding Zn finger protein